MAGAMISERRIPGDQVTGENGLVLHVLPSAVGRGAQVYARALVDLLDGPEARHQLVALFSGESGIDVDLDLGVGGPVRGLDPRVPLRLRRLCKQLGPSVIVAHGGDALKYLVLAGAQPPIVYVAIGTVSKQVHRLPRRRLWRFLLGRATAVVAVSEDVSQECRSLLSVPRSKLRVIVNGRDSAKYHPRSSSENDPAPGPPLILFVGRLTEGKRPGVFVDLVRSLRSRGLSFEADIVGDGPLRPQVELEGRDAGVGVLGERDDVAELMRGAYLLVFPSLPEGEGMPGVLIEAGLSGLPALATSVPGVRDVVANGKTGWVVDVGDTSSMVDRAFEVLSDPSLRQVIGAAARERCVNLFSLEANTASWVRLLNDLQER